MAHKFHPDKSQGNPYARAWFDEILEAYETLTDPRRKDEWLQKKWLMQSLGKPLKKPYAFVPSAVLLEARQVHRLMIQTDPFRTDHNMLAAEVLKVLEPEKISMLQSYGYQIINWQVVDELLGAIEYIEFKELIDVFPKLELLAAGSEKLEKRLKKIRREKWVEYTWGKWQPWVLTGITLLICIFIYLIAR